MLLSRTAAGEEMSYDARLTDALIALPAGTHYTDRHGVLWVRMHESISNHIESCLFNTSTGEWAHACLLEGELPDDGS